MSIDLTGRKAVVLGGDARETETLRLLKQHGAAIEGHGCPPSAEAVLGRPQAATLEQALDGAELIILPIPLPALDGSLYAPESPRPIVLDRQTLRPAAGATVITGVASPALKDAAAELGLRLHEYERDEELMMLRAPAIAEAAVCVAIQNSLVTLHQSNVLVVGFGRIGAVLGGLLAAMHARCTTATPLPLERARAYQAGFEVHGLDELPDLIGRMPITFATTPVTVVTRDVLARVAPDALVVDMAAPPGSVDHAAAKDLGVKCVWARGLGRFAPRTVAGSQWIGIQRILEAEAVHA